MTNKVKIKSIYRRYKKYPIAWFVVLNIVLSITPPYSIIGTIVNGCFVFIFAIVLKEQRNADVLCRYARLAAFYTQRLLEKTSVELNTYHNEKRLRNLYSSCHFSAGDQFYYDGAWHNVASVNFQEDLIAYDISTDEDDDLQLVWLRFENIESYQPHFQK